MIEGLPISAITRPSARLTTAIATVAACASSSPAAAWTVSATAYSPCSAGQIMADGSHVRFGSVAMNALPLGTRITLRPGMYGRRRFTVRDRYGWGTQLDIWTPSCADADRYGHRAQHVRVGWFYRRGTLVRTVARIPTTIRR